MPRVVSTLCGEKAQENAQVDYVNMLHCFAKMNKGCMERSTVTCRNCGDLCDKACVSMVVYVLRVYLSKELPSLKRALCFSPAIPRTADADMERQRVVQPSVSAPPPTALADTLCSLSLA